MTVSTVTEMSLSALKKMSKLRSKNLLMTLLLLIMTTTHSPLMIKQRYRLMSMDFCGYEFQIHR